MIKITDRSYSYSAVNTRLAIYRDCGLSRRAELAYLSHFIVCHRPTLHLACIQHYPMYILEDVQKRLGLSFFGSQMSERNFLAADASEIAGIQERWLVLAPVRPENRESELASFISSYHPATSFDAIFLFDYQTSTIQIIK